MTKRIAIALVVLAIGYEAISLVVDSFTPGPGGATSSSYATSADGLAAYAEVLQHTGRRVGQLRGKVGDAQLDPAQTVIALDPNQLTSADGAKLKAFVQGGGQLVAGGSNPGRWLSELIRDPPSWSSDGLPEARPLAPALGIQGVSSVVTAGGGSFTSPGQTTPVLGARRGALVTTAREGAGQITLLADASPLQNAYIAQADNAALGDRLAGTPGRAVTFLEGIHGYGTGTGLAALPARWKWTLTGLLLAAVALIAARFRRLGDPEPPPGMPVPPRRAHVEALGVALQRTKRPSAAAAPVVAHARELVMRRAMLDPNSKRDAIITAARTLGLEPDEARAVAGDAERSTESDLLAAGRALARLT